MSEGSQKKTSSLDRIRGQGIATDSHDSYYSSASAFYGGYENQHYEKLARLYKGAIASSIVDVLVNDSTREGFTIKATNSEDQEKLDLVVDSLQRKGIHKALRDMLRYTFIFGGALVYFDLTYPKKLFGGELRLPLEINKLKIGGNIELKGFKVIEPEKVHFEGYDTADPLSDNYYNPERWVIGAKHKVHRSRVYRSVYMDPTPTRRLDYRMFGISLLEQSQEFIRNFERLNRDVVDLMDRFRLTIFETPAESDDSIVNSNARVEALQKMVREADLTGVMVINENEKIYDVTTAISGLSDLMEMFASYLTLPATIPATKILGTPPSGLNATGESDKNNYYNVIANIQGGLQTEFIQKSLWIESMYMHGEILDFDLKYNPLESKSEEAIANVKMQEANILNSLVGSGILTVAQAQEELKKSEHFRITELESEEEDGEEDYEEDYETEPEANDQVTGN